MEERKKEKEKREERREKGRENLSKRENMLARP